MGGRLDNQCNHPDVSVFTNIGYDHTQFLGNTLTKIAAEKAGIIKSHIPVVIGETHSETREVFIEAAEKQQAPLVFADQVYDLQNINYFRRSGQSLVSFDVYKQHKLYKKKII